MKGHRSKNKIIKNWLRAAALRPRPRPGFEDCITIVLDTSNLVPRPAAVFERMLNIFVSHASKYYKTNSVVLSCNLAEVVWWIHCLVIGISHFAECRENRPMAVWATAKNLLRSAILQGNRPKRPIAKTAPMKVENGPRKPKRPRPKRP